MLHLDQVTSQLPTISVTVQASSPEEERPVSRLIIAIVVGIVIAVGAVAVVQNVLNTASNGTVSNNSIYQYGTR